MKLDSSDVWVNRSLPPKQASFNGKMFPEWLELYIDVSQYTYLEIDQVSKPRFFKFVLDYAMDQCSHVSSYIPCLEKERVDDGTVELTAKLVLGHGVHEGSWNDKRLLIARFVVGDPVGTGSTVIQKDMIVVFLEGRNDPDALQEWLQGLLDQERAEPLPDTFRVYRWNTCQSYWYEESVESSRAIDSVVLPTKLKKEIISDLEQFLDEETRAWYNRHGIPFKRSYIFYGPPGTGKTSFIKALAGRYGKHVCFLQPNHPRFTDDMLKTCLQRTPKNSIVVMEDIDALFNNRHSMNKDCPLTFTGLLNGLDGIGSSEGQLFILSTNHLERLDPALIRSGRVDRKFEFSFCTDEVLAKMFRRFYPETQMCKEFVQVVRLKYEKITAADLQQAFIANMKKSDQDVIDYLMRLYEREQKEQVKGKRKVTVEKAME